MRLDTRAFAIAGGILTAAAVFAFTLILLVGPGVEVPSHTVRGLLFGYTVTVPGALVGALWGFLYGFLGFGGFAFIYNLAAAPRFPRVQTDRSVR